MDERIDFGKIARALLYAAILMGVFLGIQVICYFLSTAFATGYALYRAMGGDQYYLSRPIVEFSHGKDALMLAGLTSTSATGVLFGIWWLIHNKNYGMAKDKFLKGIRFACKRLFILILLGFVCYGVAEYVVIAINVISPERIKEYAELSKDFVTDNLIVNIITLVIFAPIGEECLFRGLILHKFKDRMNIWVAIILQALLFSVMHGNVVQGAYVFAVGAINGFLAIYTGSVIPGIIVHMVINGFSLVLDYAVKALGENVQLSVFLLILPLFAGIMLFSLLPRDEYGQIDIKL